MTTALAYALFRLQKHTGYNSLQRRAGHRKAGCLACASMQCRRNAALIRLIRPRRVTLEAFLVSTGIVALAEIGDKTQLLAFILAAKFRKPLPIVIGILVATLANHGFAGALGSWITVLMGPQTLRWVLGLSFIGMAVWTLIPDKFDEKDAKLTQFGVFGTTLIAFFLAEMGDKTQVATIALAAQVPRILFGCRRNHVGHDDRQCSGGSPGRSNRQPDAGAAGAWHCRGDLCDPWRGYPARGR